MMMMMVVVVVVVMVLVTTAMMAAGRSGPNTYSKPSKFEMSNRCHDAVAVMALHHRRSAHFS